MAGSSDRVLRVQSRLTDRDRQILAWLADHDVLTTFHLAHALFPSLDFAQRRLLTLHQLGLIDRFRPLRPGGGSYPWHYVLGRLGADLVAASRDQPPPRPSHTTARARRIATSRNLDHRLGVNGFFTELAGHARTHPGTQLERWWSERHCAQPGAFAAALISPIRPDGHGIMADRYRRVAFFLEHDTGTEPLHVLTTKMANYANHGARGGPNWPVLFWLHSRTREQHLHHALTQADVRGPVATAVQQDADGPIDPAGPIWLTHRGSDAPRRLLDLADLGDPAPTPDDDTPNEAN
jgi:hypothetical protein